MANKRTNTVSVGMVRILKSYAHNAGADFNAAARSLDFDIKQLQNEDARIPAHLFDALWQKIITLSNDPTPGLNFGRQMTHQYPGGSLLFTLMINCSTIGDAIKISNTIDENRIWSNKVFNVLSKTLLSGEETAVKTDISHVANMLAVGTRSLQEKLKSEQTSFRILLESVRKQIALESLATKQLAICDIAFLLGYSDQSAFNHAFKRWTGKAPKAYITKTEAEKQFNLRDKQIYRP
ncbi:MAG: helix-turn-helix domain-containing protein [Pseudomonadota bacterium]